MRASYDAYTQRKQGLIEVLLTHKQNPFSREDLDDMHADRIEKLVDMSGLPRPGQPPYPVLPNYSGKRMPHLRIVTHEGEEEDGTPPPCPDTMGLSCSRTNTTRRKSSRTLRPWAYALERR